MKKVMYKVISLVLCAVFVTLLPTGGSLEVFAASNNLAVDVLNVGRGDAALIDCNGKYYLVDGGSSAYYNQFKNYLMKTCIKKNGKIVLEGVILTHYHEDHYGGLLKILKDSDFEVKNFYRHNYVIAVGGNITEADKTSTYSVIQKVKNAVTAAEANDILIKHNDPPAILSANGTSITVYPPAFSSNNHGVMPSVIAATNNSSLLVDIVSADGKLSALLMGDAVNMGFRLAVDKYKEKYSIFNRNYTVCKVGHHGLRPGSSEKIMKEECDRYNKAIHAKYNVFSVDKEAEELLKNNFAYIYSNINGSKAFRTYGGGVSFQLKTGFEAPRYSRSKGNGRVEIN